MLSFRCNALPLRPRKKAQRHLSAEYPLRMSVRPGQGRQLLRPGRWPDAGPGPRGRRTRAKRGAVTRLVQRLANLKYVLCDFPVSESPRGHHRFDHRKKMGISKFGSFLHITTVSVLCLCLRVPSLPFPTSLEYGGIARSVYTPNQLLRGGSDHRRKRAKAEPELMRKWRGEGLGLKNGQEIEGPLPPPPVKKAKSVNKNLCLCSKILASNICAIFLCPVLRLKMDVIG